jgi:hypothetical protein
VQDLKYSDSPLPITINDYPLTTNSYSVPGL